MSPKWGIYFLGFVFVSAALPEVHSEQLAETIERQLEDMRNHRIDRAYAKYTTQEFREATSLKAFEEILKQNSALIDSKQFQLTGLHFEGNRGIAKGMLITQNEENYRIVYDFDYAENSWKITAIQLLHQQEIR